MLFSKVVPPHFVENVQQTPKPPAQAPWATPSLAEKEWDLKPSFTLQVAQKMAILGQNKKCGRIYLTTKFFHVVIVICIIWIFFVNISAADKDSFNILPAHCFSV